jgi:hypothetical protein
VPNGRSPLLGASPKYLPQVERDFKAGTTTAAAEAEPGCEMSLAKIMGLGGFGRPRPIIFMHDRASRAGRHYLIILRGSDVPFLDIAGLPLDDDALAPGDWRDLPCWASGARFWTGPVDVPVGGQIRIYAGQVDPANPTHFTVAYVANGKAGIVDGYVDDCPDLFLGGLAAPGICGFIAEVKLVPRRAN